MAKAFAGINGARLDDETLELTNQPKLNGISFEVICKHFERTFADPELDLLCPCCSESIADSPCPQCKLAIGLHMCTNPRASRRGSLQWRQGSLHNGKLDAQRVIWNLHRRQLPDDVLDQKIDMYIGEGLLDEGQATEIRKCTRRLILITRGLDKAFTCWHPISLCMFCAWWPLANEIIPTMPRYPRRAR